MASTTSAALSMLQSRSSSSQPGLGTSVSAPVSISTTNGLNFTLSQNNARPQQFYFPNSSTSTSNSHPTITLDLTAPTSDSHFNRFPYASRYSPTCLNFSSSSSSTSLELNSALQTSWNPGYSTYGTLPHRQTSATSQQCLTETIAAATKVIALDPSFRSALAAAITTFVGNNEGNGIRDNPGVGEHSGLNTKMGDSLTFNTIYPSSHDGIGRAQGSLVSFPFSASKSSSGSPVNTIQIPAETSIADAVKILSECNIMAAPVKNPDAGTSLNWRTSTATAAEVGTEAVGTLGAVALGITVPATIAGLTAAAVGAAVVGGMAADKRLGKMAPQLLTTWGRTSTNLSFKKNHSSQPPVVGIQSNELILEAFKQIRENQIGSLPVVEGPKKKIVGRNIRGIRHLLLKPELFNNFRQLTVTDCMKTISSTQEISRVIPPITCKLDATLASVIHSLASMAVHRIYVVAGNENEVVGVISCFMFEPPNYSDNYLGANEMFND
ncbi:hypothetical protein GH714_038284 [Hevea brasiliensis]|uniref:CBS domain-containing protein n=1 Tax=Hevea brasiliensis TaxID=3981 RepID=A0A6A6LH14_HEVBR|nr:hypothetical protein GH714_038284 [Hevea brasiliensis]